MKPGAMATVKVLLFARLSELAGSRQADLEVGEGLTAADVFGLLAQRYPAMHELSGVVMYAVNSEYVEATHPIRPGDEVALIPPVSGGSHAV